jgi:hypothetical protein
MVRERITRMLRRLVEPPHIGGSTAVYETPPGETLGCVRYAHDGVGRSTGDDDGATASVDASDGQSHRPGASDA